MYRILSVFLLSLLCNAGFAQGTPTINAQALIDYANAKAKSDAADDALRIAKGQLDTVKPGLSDELNQLITQRSQRQQAVDTAMETLRLLNLTLNGAQARYDASQLPSKQALAVLDNKRQSLVAALGTAQAQLAAAQQVRAQTPVMVPPPAGVKNILTPAQKAQQAADRAATQGVIVATANLATATAMLAQSDTEQASTRATLATALRSVSTTEIDQDKAALTTQAATLDHAKSDLDLVLSTLGRGNKNQMAQTNTLQDAYEQAFQKANAAHVAMQTARAAAGL